MTVASARPAALPVPRGELLWTLVRTDFKSRYHDSVGGFLWALLKPLAMFVVLVAVFSFVFARQPGYRLDLLVGLFLWDFFAESTRAGIVSLHAKGFLLSKARFPAWVVVAASAANALLTLLVFAISVLLYLTVAGHAPRPAAVLLFTLYMLCLALLSFGISLAGSVLFLRYRDLNQIWDVVLQAGFFVAPVVYPLAILPERFHVYLYLWPPTSVILFSRAVLVAGTVPTLRGHLCLLAMTAAMLAAGTAVFRRYALRAAESL